MALPSADWCRNKGRPRTSCRPAWSVLRARCGAASASVSARPPSRARYAQCAAAAAPARLGAGSAAGFHGRPGNGRRTAAWGSGPRTYRSTSCRPKLWTWRSGFCAVRVRRQHVGVRRLAALNQDKRQRHAQRSHRDPMPSRPQAERQGAARHRRGRRPAGAISYQEFRNCSVHPPQCPKIHRQPA